MKQLNELATPFASVAESSDLPGQDLPWLQALRQRALTQFSEAGLPAKKEENWKYTSLWSLSQQAFTHDAVKTTIVPDECAKVALLDDAYRLVIVDGEYIADLSELNGLPEGVTVKPFSASLGAVEQQLGQQVALEKVGLTALNTLLMKEGVMVHIAGSIVLDKPIELLVINSGVTADLATHLRNMIVLDTNAQATVVEHYVGVTESVNFTNVVSEVVLAEQAELFHYKLQQESHQAFHIATLAAKQAAGSRWHTQNITLGGKLSRNDVHSRLEGEQSHTTMDGLYLLNDEQHADTHTRIDHIVPNTTSNELYKGVLNDDCHGVFNGKVIVHQDAQKTDSNQYNHNLLLSRGCAIDTKPEMEIYADDVKCGHGSTVGQLDMNQLFFLRARGLDEVTARSLLTHAFAVDVLNRIPSETVRQALSAVIEQRLPRGEKS
jgi:Fe-S cluster assembly protein SufD